MKTFALFFMLHALRLMSQLILPIDSYLTGYYFKNDFTEWITIFFLISLHTMCLLFRERLIICKSDESGLQSPASEHIRHSVQILFFFSLWKLSLLIETLPNDKANRIQKEGSYSLTQTFWAVWNLSFCPGFFFFNLFYFSTSLWNTFVWTLPSA